MNKARNNSLDSFTGYDEVVLFKVGDRRKFKNFTIYVSKTIDGLKEKLVEFEIEWSNK